MTAPRPHRSRFGALLVAVFGASVGWVALVFLHGGLAARPDWWVVLLFATLVTASENLALAFPSRIAVSPQLILVMGAIVALDDHGAVLGALIIGGSGGLVLRAFRSRRFISIVFNVGQMALSAGAAAACYRALASSGASAVAVYPVTVLAYALVNYGLVIGGISLRSGKAAGEIWANVRTAALNDFVFGILGLLLGSLYQVVGPVALVAIIAPTIAARTVFTSAARFRQAYHRLEMLYTFTREIERSSDHPDVVTSVLGQFRSLLDVAVAEFAYVGPSGWRRTIDSSGATPVVRETAEDMAAALVDAVHDGPVLSEDLPSAIQATLAAEGLTRAILAPLRGDGDLIGIITVANPLDGQPFDAEDVKLVETLANHASVSLEHARLLDRMRFDARHDPLTGLPNRYRFTEILEEVEGSCAVLLVDLDRFQEVNDTLGHHHGDLLLKGVGVRMSEEIGHKGIVARLGGDEFAVLLPQTVGGDAAQVAVSLLAALEQPFEVGELHLDITGSVGVAAISTDEEDTSKLLQQADVAMYMAKRAHSGWEMYTPERDHYSPRRLALAGELRKAIDNGDLEVHYQPKADLTTGRVVGVEALCRWRHQHYGLLGPDVFVPLAEHVGLIRPLTLRVLDAAIEEQHRLADRGFTIGMSVNLSVRSVLDVNLPDQVSDALAAHGMAASNLTLEITESSFMADPGRTIGILGRLDQLGVCISVDDFGTGYSSLSYLKRLPVTEIKIDRSFISGLLSDDSDATIVRSTVDLARNLGLRVVAEGVEDRATWLALATLGCDQAQGYYVSAPLGAEALGVWMDRTDPATNPYL